MATHEERELLAAIFWFTFEVGMCWDESGNGKRRLLGGSLLSGIKDANHAMNPLTPVRPLSDLSKLKYRAIQFSGI